LGCFCVYLLLFDKRLIFGNYMGGGGGGNIAIFKGVKTAILCPKNGVVFLEVAVLALINNKILNFGGKGKGKMRVWGRLAGCAAGTTRKANLRII
jgi:hypothetical protein